MNCSLCQKYMCLCSAPKKPKKVGQKDISPFGEKDKKLERLDIKRKAEYLCKLSEFLRTNCLIDTKEEHQFNVNIGVLKNSPSETKRENAARELQKQIDNLRNSPKLEPRSVDTSEPNFEDYDDVEEAYEKHEAFLLFQQDIEMKVAEEKKVIVKKFTKAVEEFINKSRDPIENALRSVKEKKAKKSAEEGFASYLDTIKTEPREKLIRSTKRAIDREWSIDDPTSFKTTADYFLGAHKKAKIISALPTLEDEMGSYIHSKPDEFGYIPWDIALVKRFVEERFQSSDKPNKLNRTKAFNEFEEYLKRFKREHKEFFDETNSKDYPNVIVKETFYGILEKLGFEYHKTPQEQRFVVGVELCPITNVESDNEIL